MSEFAGSSKRRQRPGSGSPSTSGSSEEEEDNDMANCLILLAQGGTSPQAGLYVYECKSCNRTFSSFQALGGHRASHKRPKSSQITAEEHKNILHLDLPTHTHRSSTKHPPKTHECSICGSQFTSGQALGGHMRRHRVTTPTRQGPLHLDLNLPAPEDDLKFHFTSPKHSIPFSSLVDCHY